MTLGAAGGAAPPAPVSLPLPPPLGAPPSAASDATQDIVEGGQRRVGDGVARQGEVEAVGSALEEVVDRVPVHVVREVEVVREVPVEVVREVKVEIERIIEVEKVVEKVVERKVVVQVPGPVQVVYRDGKEIIEKERVVSPECPRRRDAALPNPREAIACRRTSTASARRHLIIAKLTRFSTCCAERAGSQG